MLQSSIVEHTPVPVRRTSRWERNVSVLKRYVMNDILFLMFQDLPCILKASFSTRDHVKFIARQFQSLMKSYSNSNTEFVTITFLLKEKQKIFEILAFFYTF